MRIVPTGCMLIVLAGAFGCSAAGTPDQEIDRSVAAAAPTTQPAGPPSFINRVWQVAESKQVALGSVRVFLGDGTLVMTSANATPAFGQWRLDGHRLIIVEEGIDYPTDVLGLSHDEFRIRMHNPGEPVEMRLVPADQPPWADAGAPAPNR